MATQNIIIDVQIPALKDLYSFGSLSIDNIVRREYSTRRFSEDPEGGAGGGVEGQFPW